jgi:hypothetical protein
VTRQSTTPWPTAKSRERSSATQHLQICLSHLIESLTTRFGWIPTRMTSFLCLYLNPSTARRKSEGGILFYVSCLIRRSPESCVLHVQLKAPTPRTMQKLTSIIEYTLVPHGEHVVYTTLAIVLSYITLLPSSSPYRCIRRQDRDRHEENHHPEESGRVFLCQYWYIV